MNRSFLAPLCMLAIACGGGSSTGEPAKAPETPSETPAAANETPQPAATKTEEAPGPIGDINDIPKKCADGQADGICAPPREFVRALCDGYPKPDIALIMFNKNSPFSR